MTAHTNNPDTTARDDLELCCSVCEDDRDGDGVECADWPGRWHHDECARDCVECKGAALSERNNW